MSHFAKRILPIATLMALAIGIGGCTSQSPDESSIPWTRPQGWENTAPGFGGSGGNDGY